MTARKRIKDTVRAMRAAGRAVRGRRALNRPLDARAEFVLHGLVQRRLLDLQDALEQEGNPLAAMFLAGVVTAATSLRYQGEDKLYELGARPGDPPLAAPAKLVADVAGALLMHAAVRKFFGGIQ